MKHEQNGNIAYIIKVCDAAGLDLSFAVAAFYSLPELKQIHLRMIRHSENALAVAGFLEKHPENRLGQLSGLPSSPDNAVENITPGAGAIIGFGIKGGSGKDLSITGTFLIWRMWAMLALAIVRQRQRISSYPLRTVSHGGVTPDFVRLSVGLEHIDDIKKR